VEKKIGRFREAAAEEGREIPISLVTFGDTTADTLHHYRELGVVRVVLGAASTETGDAATTLRFLDRFADMIPGLA
jgi:hypothetical protein